MLLRPQHVGCGDLPDLMGKPQKDDKGFIDSGCSRHVTGNIAYLSNFKEFDGGYVTFGGGAHGGRISGKVITNDYNRFTWVFFLTTKDETSEILKNFIKEIENLVDKKVKIIRCDNGTEFKNKVMDDFCREKGIKREYSVTMTPQQNGVAERRNKILIEAARTMVYNTRTRKVEENLHIGFLENKPMIEGNGLKWLFDFNSLTQSMNYVPVATGTISDESAGTQGDLNAGTSSGKEATSQDYIVMPIWKDASYFDSPLKDVKDGPHNEDDDKDKSKDDSSPKEFNAAGQHVNTASLEVNTSRFELNTVDPSLNTSSSSNPHRPIDMFKLGASDTLKATHVEFFGNKNALKVDLGNIPNSYEIPTTSHTRIHKDHPINNVIGEVKSSVQTRRITKPTFEKRVSQLNPQALHAGRTSAIQAPTDVKSAFTLVDLEKPLVKDGDANDIDVHLYRSMIGSLMYLIASRTNIMFACKKQTVAATSTTKVEYVADASCCGQFSSNIATAIICFATNRIFKFFKMIFEGMLKNLDNKSKILIYPRFIQIILNKHKRLLKPHISTYVAPTLTQKLFSNMRRDSKGYSGVDVLLFPTMLVQGPILQSEPIILPPTILSPSRVPTPLHDSPLSGGNTSGSEEGRMTLNKLTVLYTSLSKKVKSLESDLKQTKLTYSATYSKLIMKVKKLKNKVKSRKARRRVSFIVSEDEDDLEDPSKQGRKIAQIDEDEGITLVQMGAQTQWRNEHEVESNFDFTTAEDISTANVSVTTAVQELVLPALKIKQLKPLMIKMILLWLRP
nr:putative ribonuclease H-like domain-containing protein [Tanacetum cinerariifolium]